MTEGFVGVHIGAGRHGSRWSSQYRRLCAQAAKNGICYLRDGRSALDTAVAVTALLEDSELTNAGRGSNLCVDGRVEADASVMCGRSRQWGAVGAAPSLKNPVRVAHALCLQKDSGQPFGLVPPRLLVGKGAKRWAAANQLEVVANSQLVTERALKSFNKYKKRLEEKFDTVGVVVCDREGHVAAACSSGGLILKMPGRVGQAAMFGSGVFADDGGEGYCRLAISTTGCGEHLIRSGITQSIVRELQPSEASCPTSALHRVFARDFLESRMLAEVQMPMGGAVVLRIPSVDQPSEPCEFLWAYTTHSMCVGYMGTRDRKPTSALTYMPQECVPGKAVVVHGHCFRL